MSLLQANVETIKLYITIEFNKKKKKKKKKVVKYIKQLDVSKSSAIEGVSTRVFKVAFLAIPEKLTVLFNKSLSLGIFPSRWKYAKVVPLPKDGDLTDVSNWRPVSLLPLPGKILEKTVHNRILNFFKDNHVLETGWFS